MGREEILLLTTRSSTARLPLPIVVKIKPRAQYTHEMNIIDSPSNAGRSAGPATVTPIGTGRHWLARLPPGLFAIVLGLLGLASAWRRLAGFKLEHTDLVATAILNVATGLLELLLLLLIFKLWRFRDEVRRDFLHPVHGAMLSVVPLVVMLAIALWTPLLAQPSAFALPIVLVALAVEAVFVWRVVSQLSTGAMPADMVTPALYIPVVGSGLIGAMTLQAMGLHGFAVLLFGMGLSGWALLEARVLNRLFAGPLPPPFRPTIGVEMAPAAIATLAASVLWPTLPADVILIGLGVACGPLIGVLVRWRWWSDVPFSLGFWSFSFPVAALAAVIVETVARGGWPVQVAFVAVLLATAVIAFLTVRTLILLVRGRLIPPG